jgi:pimeloyl-CoA synthetase
MSELDKLIDNLEHLHNKGIRTIKLVFCDKNIEVKKLLDEIKLRNNSM